MQEIYSTSVPITAFPEPRRAAVRVWEQVCLGKKCFVLPKTPGTTYFFIYILGHDIFFFIFCSWFVGNLAWDGEHLLAALCEAERASPGTERPGRSTERELLQEGLTTKKVGQNSTRDLKNDDGEEAEAWHRAVRSP